MPSNPLPSPSAHSLRASLSANLLCFQVETLARQALHDPVEIQVGGRSVVNKDITQLIEIRPEADRFLRLLEILGEFYENGKILIFVASQDLCDNLFRDLLKVRSSRSSMEALPGNKPVPRPGHLQQSVLHAHTPCLVPPISEFLASNQ